MAASGKSRAMRSGYGDGWQGCFLGGWGGGKAGVIPNRGCPRCHLHPKVHALSARLLLLSNPNTRLSPYLIACTSHPLLCALTFFRILVHDCMLACDHRQRRGNDAIAPCLMRKMRARCWRRRVVVGTSSLYALLLFCSLVFLLLFSFSFQIFLFDEINLLQC